MDVDCQPPHPVNKTARKISQGQQKAPTAARLPEAVQAVTVTANRCIPAARGAAPVLAQTFKEALKPQDPRLAQLEQLRQQQRLLSQQQQQLQNQLFPSGEPPEGITTGEGKKKKKKKGGKNRTGTPTQASFDSPPPNSTS